MGPEKESWPGGACCLSLCGLSSPGPWREPLPDPVAGSQGGRHSSPAEIPGCWETPATILLKALRNSEVLWSEALSELPSPGSQTPGLKRGAQERPEGSGWASLSAKLPACDGFPLPALHLDVESPTPC